MNLFGEMPLSTCRLGFKCLFYFLSNKNNFDTQRSLALFRSEILSEKKKRLNFFTSMAIEIEGDGSFSIFTENIVHATDISQLEACLPSFHPPLSD